MTFSLPAATTITLPPPLYSIFLYSSVTFISRMNSSPSRLLCCSPMSILCILDRHPHETSIPWIPELSAQPSSPSTAPKPFILRILLLPCPLSSSPSSDFSPFLVSCMSNAPKCSSHRLPSVLSFLMTLHPFPPTL